MGETTTSTEISEATTGDPTTFDVEMFNTENYWTPSPGFTIYNPPLSDWECLMFGGTRENGMRWRPEKGREPNWFWRKMQFLVFGNRWVWNPREG